MCQCIIADAGILRSSPKAEENLHRQQHSEQQTRGPMMMTTTNNNDCQQTKVKDNAPADTDNNRLTADDDVSLKAKEGLQRADAVSSIDRQSTPLPLLLTEEDEVSGGGRGGAAVEECSPNASSLLRPIAYSTVDPGEEFVHVSDKDCDQ